jgi:hypothetical protein
MASTPPERPWPLYRSNAGPSLPLPDFTWREIPQALVDGMVASGLLAPVQADGLPPRVAYWLITEVGRAAVDSGDGTA